jgi:UDP-2,3-diacylglucosamine pyrophosphatase LpxH
VENGPIIVVSDTHIGHQAESACRFEHFLKWLGARLLAGTLDLHTQDGALLEVAAPEKLILLGDFLELWGPREADYTNPVADGYRILELLYRLHCDKIYVPGNHDDTAARYFRIDARKAGYHFAVVPKHYPNSLKGEQIGKNTYFFLHGHQFSRTWGARVVKFFDFIGQFSYESYEASPRALQAGFIVLVLSVILALLSLVIHPLAHALDGVPAVITAVLAVIWAVLCVLGVAWIWRGLQKAWNTPGGEHMLRFTESKWFNRIIGKPKYLDVRELVNRRYYDRGKDTIDANIIVFGHTHVPQLCLEVEGTRTVDGKSKGFVNTGSWVVQREQHDIFAYIGNEGPQLFEWNEETGKAYEFESRQPSC